ncbi:hypothetical protein MPTK1_5g06620 [Marchantia polymorpha subsp. ruderalis]|uniref:Uncharacterized protein n=2 Tax=Marchantia polymorpha TaxID=3197 RepID=A0AAF6BFM9_MARPO|nr:hypothetical protein MARPO_0171s0021 [Marchantia polymorpha]BBN10813.1 hypothetical protein Mp_5g06620 [Marchantia polymorpha subsp. ruderalis]|eukprot:PTQ28179.1 hypothetical protein MARPO_0171s0021 [Marchantia polymorpha]
MCLWCDCARASNHITQLGYRRSPFVSSCRCHTSLRHANMLPVYHHLITHEGSLIESLWPSDGEPLEHKAQASFLLCLRLYWSINFYHALPCSLSTCMDDLIIHSRCSSTLMKSGAKCHRCSLSRVNLVYLE